MQTTSRPIALSGIQPTGQPTLGNLLGAFKPFTQFQHSHQVFFMVVDHHAITARQNPKDLAENSLNVAAWYLASGLDPKLCTLFIQSHVPQHVELGWILTTFTQMGELERMTQYKDKGRQNKDAANVGLFSYPVLMAADILLYQTQVVPVGDDQIQHVELCRDIALRFNNHYEAKVFTIPKAVKPVAAERVMDLQEPERKMSKSRPGKGTILLLDAPTEAAKKIKAAQTDSINHIAYNPTEQPGVANLLEILAACRGTTPQAEAESLAGQGYGTLKTTTADAVVTALEPLQAEYYRLLADKAELQRIFAAGAAHAQTVASQTLAHVKATMGYLPAHG